MHYQWFKNGNIGKLRTTSGLPKYGLDKVIFSSGNFTVLHIGAGRITIWLFVVNFNFVFSIGQRLWSDGILIPVLRQAPPVVCHAT